MDLKPNHIKLNGQSVELKTLLQKTQFESHWENDFYTFLKEWYSDVEFIRVQTSGSTGKPKIIKLKKHFVAASAKRTLNYFNLRTNDKILHCLPTKYIAGKLMLVRAIIGQLDLHLIDPASDFRLLEKQSFNFAAMVPTQVSKLLNIKTSNLEQLLIGGDAISAKLEKQLQKIRTACFSSYGMTETATHIAIRKLNGANASSYYNCLEGISVQLSETNCLQILMQGLSKPVLQTNDIAELKDDKTFRILGRADNVIISGGIKYSPETIEKKLETELDFPFMISSQSDEKLGKYLVLLVEKKETPELLNTLNYSLNNTLTKFECPRQIIFVDHLPRTENGKLKRK